MNIISRYFIHYVVSLYAVGATVVLCPDGQIIWSTNEIGNIVLETKRLFQNTIIVLQSAKQNVAIPIIMTRFHGTPSDLTAWLNISRNKDYDIIINYQIRFIKVCWLFMQSIAIII